MRRRHAAAAMFLCGVSAWSAPDRARQRHGRPYGRRGDVLAAARSMAAELSLEAAWVEATLAKARYVPGVTQLIMPAATPLARNWSAYRSRFVEARRIDAGVRWWRRNEPWLDAAEERFGVPAEIVVGVVGIETFYGRITGSFRVLDALATLSFDFPSGRSNRSDFFRSELGQFLRLVRREGWEPTAVMGSYAGAIGLPQFMPSSVLNYAIDFDEDGRIELTRSSADVVGSVANFLAGHGWRRGMPTHYPVEPPVDTIERARLLVPDIVPSFTAAQMAERGALLDPVAMRHEGPLALVELLNGDGAPSYVAGTQNFYVLTRYNASSYYALAVVELGRAITAAR